MKSFFYPTSIALIGASEGTEKIGGKTLDAILSHGYEGHLYPVHPKRSHIAGLKAYSDVMAIDGPVDLAIIAIPAPQVCEAVLQCGRKGIPYVLVVSSGFNEAGPEGRALQTQLREAARQAGVRISGPNAEGLFTTRIKLAATFSPAIHIKMGNPDSTRQIGIVSQSGGLGFGFYNRGRRDNLDFNHIVSVGNQVDLEINDYAEYIIEQPETAALMMYVESFVDARRFVTLTKRAADLHKPIVMVKVGRSEAGGKAAASHTGALASPVKVVDAVLDACGVLRAEDQGELLDIAAGLILYPGLKGGNRIAVVSPSGGTAVWLTDALQAHGFELPTIDPESQAKLQMFIPSFGSTVNPIDITAQTTTHGYAATLEVLAEADNIDAVVLAASFAHEKRLISEGEQIAKLSRSIGKPVLLYSYTVISEGSQRRLSDLGLHCFTTIRGCVLALAAMRDYRDFQALYQSTRSLPAVAGTVQAEARNLLNSRPGRQNAVIPEFEAKQLLKLYGVAIQEEAIASTPDQARALAAKLGYPVALKVHSADIAHKTEAGAVALGIGHESELDAAFHRILKNAKAYAPDAVIDGILVQPMARPGVEMMAGIVVDAQFGPMVMVGTGGIFAEVLEDTALAPAPMSLEQSQALIRRLKGSRLLDGVRGQPKADRESLAQFLVQLSIMASDLQDDLTEFDVNPVFVHPQGHGITIVDALGIRASQTDTPTTSDPQ